MKKVNAKDVDLTNKNIISEFCESCALGKATKLPHRGVKKEETRTEHVTIHSDIMGPMRTKSIGSKIYFLTYLCSITEYSFVYFLKNKSERFESFKEFKSYLLTNTKIKEFRTNNGTEYLSNEFQNYLKHHGIKHNTSVAYCQSNGKAERLNRTLVEKARCMIIAADASLNLWTAAVDTASYLRNISTSLALNGMSPHEALFKRQPKISHLRVFGAPAYPLDINNRGDKL
jgi:transposase InsO family protein